MTDHAAVYVETKDRITDLLADAGPEGAATTVPACPDWTAKDLAAHLAGLTGDWLAGKVNGYGSDDWTEAQVEARREVGLDAILDEWDANTSGILPHLDDPGAHGAPDFMPVIVITDLVSHEHDLRHALGRPGARDSGAVATAVQSLIGGLRLHLASTDLPPLRVEATGLRDWMVGRGEPAATLRAEPFTLLRALSGRRTMDEVRALDWEGDPEPFLPHLMQEPFSWRETPLDE